MVHKVDGMCQFKHFLLGERIVWRLKQGRKRTMHQKRGGGKKMPQRKKIRSWDEGKRSPFAWVKFSLVGKMKAGI